MLFSIGLFIVVSFIPLLSCSLPRDTRLTRSRIASELKDIITDGLTFQSVFSSCREECGIRLAPLQNDLHEWHFSFTGLEGSPFEGGIYHGRILLDKDYPRKAPRVLISTPSGRWKVDTDICLSASAHHQEVWNPSWNLRTLVLSLRTFMITNPGEIGSLQKNVTLQRELALESVNYHCPTCGLHHQTLLATTGQGTIIHTEVQTAVAEGRASPVVAREVVSTREVTVPKRRAKRLSKNAIHRTTRQDWLVFARKVMLYSGTVLLLSLWKYCIDRIERHFRYPRPATPFSF